MIEFLLFLGIIVGSAVSAIILKEFKVYFKVPGRQYMSAFVGGMGGRELVQELLLIDPEARECLYQVVIQMGLSYLIFETMVLQL